MSSRRDRLLIKMSNEKFKKPMPLGIVSNKLTVAHSDTRTSVSKTSNELSVVGQTVTEKTYPGDFRNIDLESIPENLVIVAGKPVTYPGGFTESDLETL